MPEHTERSYCRICQAFCGMVLTVDAGRITKIRGDKGDPASQGYACFKGLQAIEQHYGEGRLLRSLHRRDGMLEPGNSSQILSEAGQKLKSIVEKHGPSSVAFFHRNPSSFQRARPRPHRGIRDRIGNPSFVQDDDNRSVSKMDC